MALRQEKVVFLGSLALLGLMTWPLLRAKTTPRGSRARGEGLEFQHHVTPEVDVALPRMDARPSLERELFAPPRDTHPLPPLTLIEPPRQPLAGLFPPGDPEPAPRAYGLLRTTATTVDRPDLFDLADELADAGDAPGDVFGGTGSVAEDLAAAAAQDEDPSKRFEGETPAERMRRLEGYRRRYDWIERSPGDQIFGRIENENRFSLATDPSRRDEAIQFVQLDPETGREWFANVGAPPIPFERNAIVGFDFAATVANEIEVRRRRIGETLSRSDYEEALRLGAYAIEHHLEAPRALVVAEELARLALGYDDQDPAPRLLLARAMETGFRFEEAFAEYEGLLENFGHRAEVHARLARLLERFLLFDEAEARFQKAVETNRASWEARFGYGGFLARRGRHAEAIEHLTQANKAAPTAPELAHVRVDIRVALADAHLALGEVEEAGRIYGQALTADPNHQRALAGSLSCGTTGAARPVEAALQDESEGFELLVARGLAELRAGAFEEARDRLLLAVEADPLRAHRPYGALSYLAEVTGNETQALDFAAEALVVAPSDAYALYQRGRLLGRQDDYQGAREALLGALETELDFEDALVALGQTAFRLGRFDDAERYFQRALSIHSERPEVHALRGINFLQLGSVPEAAEAFDASLALESDNPTARCGAAWCVYLGGDVTEALILLRNIDDSRRDFAEDDAWRVWARTQIERVQDHVEKVEWRDSFNRKKLINGWYTREGSGPVVSMDSDAGAVKIEGVFDRTGTTQIYREYPAGDFVSFEAKVWISPSSNVRTGIFVARERQRRRDEVDVLSEASVSRHKDGNLQLRFVNTGQPEDLTDMSQALPTGAWTRLSISRTGDSNDTAVTIALDGIPLVENVTLSGLGASTSPLLLGLFAEGESGRQVQVKMDDVSVVYRSR